MRTGDVFGEGVYLSSELPLAHSFAARSLAAPASEVPRSPAVPPPHRALTQARAAGQLGRFLSCVAVCEVVLHPSVRRKRETAELERVGGRPMHSFPHTYYVCPDPSFVRVTHLLFFTDGPAPARAPRPALQQAPARGWLRAWWSAALALCALALVQWVWARAHGVL
jgi:hypothetical protein